MFSNFRKRFPDCSRPFLSLSLMWVSKGRGDRVCVQLMLFHFGAESCVKFLAKHPGAYFRGSCDKLPGHVYCMLIFEQICSAFLYFFLPAMFRLSDYPQPHTSSLSLSLSLASHPITADKSNSFRALLRGVCVMRPATKANGGSRSRSRSSSGNIHASR